MSINCCRRNLPRRWIEDAETKERFFPESEFEKLKKKQPCCGKVDRFVCNVGVQMVKSLAFVGSVVMAAREFEVGKALLNNAANEVATAGYLLAGAVSEGINEAAPYIAPTLSALWAVPSVVNALANKQWKKAAFMTSLGLLAGIAPSLAKI